MSIYSKLGSGLTTLFSGKTAKKVVSEAASITSADSKVIKTTSQTIGSKKPAIAGGTNYLKSSANNFAKGVSKFSQPAGKVVLGVGVATGSALLLSKGYASAKADITKTQDVINYENLIKAQNKELDLSQRLIDMNNSDKGGNEGISSEAGGGYADGSSGSPFGLSDTYDEANKDNGTNPLIMIGAVLGVGALGYYGYKKIKKKK